MVLRRVEAWVEFNDDWQVMVFNANNFDWSPQSVCDPYRRRWDIEVFFKQVEQSLKFGSFLGHSANAVRWRVCTELVRGGEIHRMGTARPVGVVEIPWDGIGTRLRQKIKDAWKLAIAIHRKSLPKPWKTKVCAPSCRCCWMSVV